MKDLAPDIVRQRLLIEGYFTAEVDPDVIRSYFDLITSELALRTYGSPTIFAPGGEGKADNEGYDAFVPLIDSGISLYVWSRPRFLSVVAFTCKQFETDLAVACTQRFFGMDAVESMSF